MAYLIEKTIVGWEEWFSLPVLGLPAIKAKIDTGAKTSALHAINIKSVKQGSKQYVTFEIHPMHKSKKVTINCKAPLVDRRFITDSGGHKELRYVIHTPIGIGGKIFNIEMTLTDRKLMAFRMLLGREAMRKAELIVDPTHSYCLGKLSKKQVLELYQ